MKTAYPDKSELKEVIEILAKEAVNYFDKIDDIPVRDKNADSIANSFTKPLPENGEGAMIAH